MENQPIITLLELKRERLGKLREQIALRTQMMELREEQNRSDFTANVDDEGEIVAVKSDIEILESRFLKTKQQQQ